MIIKRVKIISAAMPNCWYAQTIGAEFFVTNGIESERIDNYKVIPVGIVDSDDCVCYIEKSDVEIIESFNGDIVTEVKIARND